jgi:ankyrin repeat protein
VLQGIAAQIHTEITHHAQKQEVRYENDKQRECHQVFKTSTYEQFKNINRNRVQGTCRWVLEHEKYIQWQQSPKDDLLWISADPGCGKSVLSKSLIDNELRSTETHLVCYFFFKDNEEQESVSTALCALLHQLFGSRPQLLRHAMTSWEKNGNKLQKEIDELWRILIAAVTDPIATNVTCVLDALDECRESERTAFIQLLKEFYRFSFQAAPRSSRSKFLVTSRPYNDIEVEFQGLPADLPTIRLLGEEHNDKISDEINMVIGARVSAISRELDLQADAQLILERKLLSITHRTYLWLHLVVEEVRSSLKRTPDRISEIIDSIPEKVEDAYENLLNKSSKKARDRREAEILLHIIVAASRPLTLKEMDVAFQIGTGSQRPKSSYKELNLDKRDLERRIRNLCGLFVFVNDSRVYLIHQTAKEFLITRDLKTGAPHGCWKHSLEYKCSQKLLAEVCTQYLSFTDFAIESANTETRERKQDEDLYDFMEYSAVNWPVHFRNAQVSQCDSLVCQAFNLYDIPSRRFEMWFPIHWKTARHYVSRPDMDNTRLAAFNGHDIIIRLLLAADNADVESKDRDGRTPLSWAAENGHEAVVRLLLATGNVDVEPKDRRGRTPLSWAAEKGHEAVVRLLLATSIVDVKSKDVVGRTPLSWAAENGHEAVVRLLLAAGIVDVESKDMVGRTPLSRAAENGHEAVVRLLLATGIVDVGSKDMVGWTPLLWAVENGHEVVVRLLLAAGVVDVESKNTVTRTMLLWAVENGHEAVVRLLLATSIVDVESKDVVGRTLLSRAAGYGHEAVVRLLLATGNVDVESKDMVGQTPLSRAAENGHEAVVRLLLATGIVDVESKDIVGQTPLSWAAENGHEAVVRLLLATGNVDVESKDRWDRTPLLWAAKNGHEAVVRLLLATGNADIYSDKDGEIPQSLRRRKRKRC